MPDAKRGGAAAAPSENGTVEFNEDAGMPLEERFGSSIMLAMRPWELGMFHELRREPDEKTFGG